MSEIKPNESLDQFQQKDFNALSPENKKIKYSESISERDFDRLEGLITGMEDFETAKEIENEYKGGRFGDMPKESGKDRHHIPADGASNLEREDGPAIQMERMDHRQTDSFGSSRDAKEYREQQRVLINEGRFEDAMKMDIESIKEKFGDKYDVAISEMLDYYKTMA